MPNPTLSEALKEARTLCPTNVVELPTLEISHPAQPDSIYMVQDRKNWNLTIPGVGVKTFEGIAFKFVPPASGENGVQQLDISLDNVDRRVSDFIDAVKESNDPVILIHRVYLSSDTATPQNDPPLTLTLRDIRVVNGVATGRASFADIINKPFPHPSETYTRERFPSLGNL